MSFNILPTEIIFNIIKILSRENSILFNCCLVSRLWCLLSVPLLWSKPFNNVIVSNNISVKNDKFNNFNSVIEIYLRFLDDNTKIHIGIPINSRKPLFDYYKFMEELDYVELYLAVSNCKLIKRQISHCLYSLTQYTTHSLLNLFFLNCKKLSILSYNTCHLFDNIPIMDAYVSPNMLSNLKTIHCDAICNKISFVSCLIRNCKFIEKMNILMSDKDTTSFTLISELIVRQSNLKEFICRNKSSITADASVLLNALIKIQNNYETLSCVEFNQFQFPEENDLYEFSIFSNIKLTLKNCIVFNKSLNAYNSVDINFIFKYFEFIPNTKSVLDYNENKNSNTIIIKDF